MHLLPFHDLGIWTAHTMDYLGPSIQLALDHITQNHLDISPQQTKSFIGDHHKFSQTPDPLAEKLRKAEVEISIERGTIFECQLHSCGEQLEQSFVLFG